MDVYNEGTTMVLQSLRDRLIVKDLAAFIETLGGPVDLVSWSFGDMPA
jgi:hypothetical protein